jgi:hypothetical protein
MTTTILIWNGDYYAEPYTAELWRVVQITDGGGVPVGYTNDPQRFLMATEERDMITEAIPVAKK